MLLTFAERAGAAPRVRRPHFFSFRPHQVAITSTGEL